MRRTYDEQSSTIDLTFDPGTQPSYLAPPYCPQCRRLITVKELAAAAVAAAVDPPSEPAAAAAGPEPRSCLVEMTQPRWLLYSEWA